MANAVSQTFSRNKGEVSKASPTWSAIVQNAQLAVHSPSAQLTNEPYLSLQPIYNQTAHPPAVDRHKQRSPYTQSNGAPCGQHIADSAANNCQHLGNLTPKHFQTIPSATPSRIGKGKNSKTSVSGRFNESAKADKDEKAVKTTSADSTTANVETMPVVAVSPCNAVSAPAALNGESSEAEENPSRQCKDNNTLKRKGHHSGSDCPSKRSDNDQNMKIELPSDGKDEESFVPPGVWNSFHYDPRQPVVQLMEHVVDTIDKAFYEERMHNTDPRDIAYAYLLIGERLWVNVLYRVATRAGFADIIVQDLDQFSAQFKALEPANQNAALNQICSAKELDFAVEMYKKRLRVAHPSHFKIRKNPSHLSRHFVYLYAFKGGPDFQYSDCQLESMADKLGLHSAHNNFEVNGHIIKSLAGERNVAFASTAVVNSTLALLYIQDYIGINGFWATRNKVAHYQGDDDMYKAYVKKLFRNHPHGRFLFTLPRYERTNVRRYRDESWVDIAEEVPPVDAEETEEEEGEEY